MFLASVETVLESNAPASIIAFILLVGAWLASKKYSEALNIKGELAAKDSVIATNHQTIEAIEGRLNEMDIKIKALEEALEVSREKEIKLTEELQTQQNKYKDLENFAAPALGEKLIEMFVHQEEVLSKVASSMDNLHQAVLSAIESQ